MNFKILFALFLYSCLSYAAPKGVSTEIKVMNLAFPMVGRITVDASDGEYIEKRVPEATLALLRAGDLAIAKTREHFPAGMGNIRYDIEKSKGRSIEIHLYRARCHYSSRFIWPEDDAHLDVDMRAGIARACKGSRCADTAYDAAALLNNLVPAGTRINVVSLSHFDHGFVVLGDIKPGDPENERLVVVDPWPPKSQALLVEDYAFGDSSDFVISYSYLAEGPSSPNTRADEFAKSVIDANDEEAISHLASSLPAGTMLQTMVWEGTHAAAYKRVITYRGDL
jgi:hypothetical protein